MDRRKFIQNSLLVSAGALILGSGYSCKKHSQIIGSEFLYKSEKDIPTMCRLDLCSLCQLKCPGCFMNNTFEKAQVGYGYVTLEVFKEFLEKNPYINTIEIAKSGEVVLNPELISILEYAHSKKIKINIDGGVNLNTLSDELAEALVKYQVQSIVVSIDGASSETYPIYRVGGDFNQVMDNVKKINKYKKQYNTNIPHLTYKFIIFGFNEHEIDLAAKIAKEHNMDIYYDINYTPEYFPVKDTEMIYKKTGYKITNYKHDRLLMFWDEYNNDKSEHSYFVCHALWTNPVINWDGELYSCCVHKQKLNINVFKEGLYKALNHPKVLYTRKMLTDFSTPLKDDIPCTTCEIYHLMKTQLHELRHNIY